MSDISKIKINGTTYDIKDDSARSDILDKQDTLVSGSTIKTINNNSILGSGNLAVVQGDYDAANTSVELEQGTNALSFIQTTDGLSVTANTGSGNDFIDRELVSKTYVSQYQTQAQVEALILDELSRFDKLDYEIVQTLPATGTAGVRYLIKHATDDRYEEYIYVNNQWYDIGATDEVNLNDYYTKQETDLLLADKADTTDLPTLTSELTNDGDGTHNFVTFGNAATDNTYGVVKTNSSQSISLDANGKLTIGGRLGQFSSQEIPVGGLYYPLTIQPEKVAENSLLISEATGLTIAAKRNFALFAGAGITLKKTAAAGATSFEVSNTFGNRFTCACARGGYATIDEASAGTIIVKVTSVHTANNPNTQLVPYSGATESNNNIIITTDAPLSTTDSITKLRLYGSMTYDSSVHIGQGVGTGGVSGKGKLFQLGQSQCSLDGNSILIGNGIYNSKNRVILVGANHINNVQGACLTGEGHDTTNGTFVGLAEHGKYSLTTANTAFAIGNGTSNTERSNLFEVQNNNGATEMIMKSPNGTAYKITVDDSGNLSTTLVV